MARKVGGRAIVPVEPVNFFSMDAGARIDNASTSATFQPRTSRFHRMAAPYRSPASSSRPEDALQVGGRWCSGPGVAQLGIRSGSWVFPQRLRLALVPTGGRPMKPRNGFVEVWIRVSNPRRKVALNLAIQRDLVPLVPDRSLLGAKSFGMGSDFSRIGFFVIPAPSGRNWSSDNGVAAIQEMDLPVDLASLGLDAKDFVIRATLDGPAFCFVGLGLRARTSTLSKKNIIDGI